MIIDMHSHILPCCDHGSTSVEMSVNQLKAAKDAGVDVIVATPHFYLNQDNVDDFISRREECYNNLKEAVKGTELEGIKILKGAEVTLMTDLCDLDDLNRLCIEGTNNILIEMPMAIWTGWLFDSLYKISSQKRLNPIIAHIDRYPKEEVEKLLQYDIPFQINASSLMSPFKRGRILKLVNEGYVAALGSDMHLEGDMYKQYKKALRILKKSTDDIMNSSAEIIGV